MTDTGYRIFIVEDDPVIAGALADHLGKWGYGVKIAGDFAHIDTECGEYAPHLVIMDIMLPFFNGFYWCAALRKTSDSPVLFLSSAGEDMNIVMAMNMGGDDFLTKPCSLGVLTAKVQALLRRAYASGSHTGTLERGGLVLRPAEGDALWQGEKILLTRNEQKILQLLMENAGPVTRDRLMEALWEGDDFVDDNTLTVNVNRLRRKLAAAGLEEAIETRKGQGYRLTL